MTATPAVVRRSIGSHARDMASLIAGGRVDARLAALRRGDPDDPAAGFDALYREAQGDPWRVASRAGSFQDFKYDTLAATLPNDRRFRSALDLGCGNGVLTQRLSARCDHILGVDISSIALSAARSRTYVGAASFEQGDIQAFSTQGQSAAFDLIVISDMLYYLLDGMKTAGEVDALTQRFARMTACGGCVLLGSHCVTPPVDHASRVSRRAHGAFLRSPLFDRIASARRPFFWVDVFQLRMRA